MKIVIWSIWTIKCKYEYKVRNLQGFYNNPECRYVNPNSGQTKYSFKVMLNSCGTHFVDEFSTGKQAYLENVLVVQNEPGIQEVSTAAHYVEL